VVAEKSHDGIKNVNATYPIKEIGKIIGVTICICIIFG
jgi:hypothetical protein